MKQRLGFVAAAFCVVFAFAGCGSVTGNLDFKAPSGWTATPPIMGHMQMWIKRNQQKDNGEVVMLLREAASSKDDLFGNSQFTTNMRDVERKPATLCGNQPAIRLSATGTGKNGGDDAIEGYSTTVGDSRYATLYIRPVALPPDPAAETALRSLCPKG